MALKLKDPQTVIATVARYEVRLEDLVKLNPKVWINDGVMNYMGARLRRIGVDRLATNHVGTRTFTITSFFYTQLCLSSGFAGVMTWTKNVDVFLFDYFAVPINVRNVHWRLAVIDLRRSTISVFDSSPIEDVDRAAVCAKLDDWLAAEHLLKRGVALPRAFEERVVLNPPRQRNGYDCGVFVIAMMHFVAFGIMPTADNVRQDDVLDDMPYWRARIAATCVDSTLPDGGGMLNMDL